jgi:hypothetical protein
MFTASPMLRRFPGGSRGRDAVASAPKSPSVPVQRSM